MSVSPVRPIVTSAPRRVVDAPLNGAVVSPLAAAPPPTPSLDCQVTESNPDGSFYVRFYVSPEVGRRLRRRADHVPLADYIWLNVLRQAIESHVY